MRRTPEWLGGPQPHTYPTGALFESRPPLRKLVVLADADLLSAPDDQTLSRKAILTALLAHPYIKLFRYRDEGPPADVPRESYGPPTAGLTAARGWAELLPPDAGEGRGLLHADDSSIVYSGIFGAGAAHARQDSASAAYRDRNPEAAADQRERDILMVEIAQVVQADFFVTERPYLFEQPVPVAQGVTLCRTAEALAMTGLYLRSQNEFVIPYVADGSGHTMNEWLCYMVGAVELLPEAWRWSKPRLEGATADTREALTGLREAMVQRVQRSLRTRDSFHRAYNLPQRRDAVRTTLVELDAILVTLMGAVDASARFIHVLLGVNGHQRDAGWQRERWLRKVADRHQPLADLFAAGTPLAHTLTVLRRLRNTVHGQMIRATMQQNGRWAEAPIKLPGEYEQEIFASMDQLGGRAVWGVRSGLDRSTVIDPGDFVERLFPIVLTLLNEVMAETPPERFDGQPPSQNDWSNWYSERNRLSIRWQLGFELAGGASQLLNTRGFRCWTFSRAELAGEAGDNPLYHPAVSVPGATPGHAWVISNGSRASGARRPACARRYWLAGI